MATTSVRTYAPTGTEPTPSGLPFRGSPVLVPDAVQVHARPSLPSASGILGRRLAPIPCLQGGLLATSANTLVLPIASSEGALP